MWLHLLLFVLTVGTTSLVGGWAYSVTILAILGCHEFGHYFACRYYDVDASLPYFLPLPIPLTGTLGAFIRIREPIPSKRMLFDIGIAGPIAGFLVAVPALFFGVALSTVAPIGPEEGQLWLGEPLLVQLASRVLWGSIPDSQTLLLHPIGFAAWFGLLATALNLFPDRTARRRPHFLRGSRPPFDLCHRHDDRRGDRPGVSIGELDRLDRPDDRHAGHLRPAPSAHRSTSTSRWIARG